MQDLLTGFTSFVIPMGKTVYVGCRVPGRDDTAWLTTHSRQENSVARDYAFVAACAPATVPRFATFFETVAEIVPPVPLLRIPNEKKVDIRCESLVCVVNERLTFFTTERQRIDSLRFCFSFGAGN
jgi:hypothetical protein